MVKIHQNAPEIQIRLFRFIVNLLKRYSNPQTRKQFLVNCLISHGYVKNVNPLEQFESSENETQSSESESENENEQELVSGYSDTQRTSKSNRTFIQTNDQRMLKLQQRIKENDETDFDKAKETITVALEQVYKNIPGLNYEEILKVAMDMYLTVRTSYRSKIVTDELGGDVKRGTLVLLLYYALLQYRINISPQQLVVYFNNSWNVDILPKAEKNLKIIFGNKITFKPEVYLCNMDFDLKTKQEINKVIDVLKEKRVFSEPATEAQVAAAIYYVTNKIGSGKTYTELKVNCRVSPDTIRKIVRVIEKEF
uniref:Transcription factor TFIIB cyclin-like domain-containing protein n=1 Tax=viral metagenome TaxID=1070528 RepID=A0A6C0AYM5_9ZZZZ